MLLTLNEKMLRGFDPKSVLKKGRDRAIVWDETQKGLGLVVHRSGTLAWVLRYSIHGRPGKTTLGQWPDLTYDAAKKKAQRLRGQIADGVDPARARDAGFTVKDLCEKVREDYYPRLKASTVRSYDCLWDNHILPRLGQLRVEEVGVSDVAKLHHSMRGLPRSANQSIAVLARALHLSEAWGYRPPNSNPCTTIQRFRETKRERYLTVGEMAELGKRVRQFEAGGWNPYAVAALRFAMLTGMRRGEVAGLKWSDVRTGQIVLEEHKTSRKMGAKTIPLPPPAMAILEGLTQVLGCPYVFAGEQGGTCLASMRKLWDRVREETSFADVRIHDLRHTFASIGIMDGLTLEQIGGLLGHKAAATTKRYAHLMKEAAMDAASKVSQSVADRLG